MCIHTQIPATKLPREIHFKSDKEEIEAFVSRDAQDEDLKTTTTLSETSVDFNKTHNISTSNGSGVFDNCLGESSSSYNINHSSSLVETPNQLQLNDDNPSPKAKRSPLDLSPENFFITSNEINGKFSPLYYHYFCVWFIKSLKKFTNHIH